MKRDYAFTCMQALEELDPRLLAEAESLAGLISDAGAATPVSTKKKHEHRPMSAAAVAACICAVALGVYLTLLMTANGTFQKIAAFFEKTGETESEPTDSDTDLPDVPKMPVNPYEGMSEDDLIALYAENEKGYGLSEQLTTIDTPLYFIYMDKHEKGIMMFDKQSGECLPVRAVSDAAAEMLSGIWQDVTVDTETGKIYLITLTGTSLTLWKTDLRFNYAEPIREWDALTDTVYGLMVYDGGLYYVTYKSQSGTFEIRRYDLASGIVSYSARKEGSFVNWPQYFCRSGLYYSGREGCIMRYDPATDTDECVVPASFADEHNAKYQLFVCRVEANGEILQLAVAGEGSLRYLWYNTLTGKSGEMKGGLPAGGSEWMLNDDGTRLVSRPLEGENTTAYSFTLDGLPCTLTDPVGSLQLLCYDGTCLYLRLTCPAQPDGAEKSALVLFDPASGEVYCSSGYVRVKTVTE